ncbi:hypothetical protein SAMN02949497_3875 [Methylomagnum ishizawai]|uniref:Uncharacterized protein n=1 Tax=Methylomagnum ishizawai TaxID=1760988 RepID=A0A1Y6D9S5_9GAMM|nr:hypothetical protein [Methylomagnum ishizawai]SMF96475.1 hypothetical protein SAMN02949497_3875 [Methylomagnum ishizawai]
MKTSHLMFAGVAFAVVAEALLLAGNKNGEEEWASFRDAHHCVPVAATDGSNRAGYQCDDGQVHYRWRQMR